MKKLFEKLWLVALFVIVLSGIGIAAYNSPWVRTQALYLNDVLVTSTAAELNLLDAVTLSGDDASIITGTAGTTDYTAKWNADGDLVDGNALSGSDATIVTGTAGTSTYAAVWNADGDIVDGPGVPAIVDLSNIVGTAIPVSLISDTAATDDLGTEALYWKKAYFRDGPSFEGTSDDDYQTTFLITDPTTSDRTITVPDSDQTIGVATSAGAGAIDAITEIAAGLKTGSDVKLVTGTAGTDTYVPKWNGDGDIVDGYALIDDDTMATAAATNIPSAESVKAYVDTIPAIADFSSKVTMGVDFNGDLIDGTTELIEGEGSGTGNSVDVVAGEGGNISILTSSADAAIGANGSGISGANLNWRADSGGLVAECLLQVDDITNVMIFFGFTDATAATVEAPIFLVAGDIDSDADNACGILYDTDGTTAEWCHGGVAATTDTVPAFSGTAPVNATDVTLRVEVSATGGVRGYINGVAIGVEVASAVTATTPLVPILFVANRDAAARTVLADYIYVQADRR